MSCQTYWLEKKTAGDQQINCHNYYYKGKVHTQVGSREERNICPPPAFSVNPASPTLWRAETMPSHLIKLSCEFLLDKHEV